MKRREFITLIGGAVAWPLAARGQQAGKVYRLGVLATATSSIDNIRSVTLPELAKAGFIEGQNLIVDARAGTGAQTPELAQALVAGDPDAIIGVSDVVTGALKAASNSVPIVMSFAGSDPVAAGFAASIMRPAGNITGVGTLASELNAKRLTLLHEAIPTARRIAALTVSEQRYEVSLQALRAVAASEGFDLQIFFAEPRSAYPAAFTAMRSAGADALIIVSAPSTIAMPTFSLHSLLRLSCRRYASGATWPCRVVCSVTVPANLNCVVARRITSCASFAVPRPVTCRSRGRHGSTSR
jgi:putative tryptophan/tyrosine transport system substrate-binding protein